MLLDSNVTQGQRTDLTFPGGGRLNFRAGEKGREDRLPALRLPPSESDQPMEAIMAFKNLQEAKDFLKSVTRAHSIILAEQECGPGFSHSHENNRCCEIVD